MTRAELYAKAVDTACQMVLDEGGSLHLGKIADKLKIDLSTLESCIGDRRHFSSEVTIRLGAKIWEREGSLFGQVADSPQYKSLNGASQIRELLRSSFLYSYKGHPDFWRWLSRFEQFVIKEKIPPEALGEYADQLAAFYPVFYQAFEKGLGDGTIRGEVEPTGYYNAVTQALMNLCVKHSTAQILSTDTTETGAQQISLIIDMAIHYLKR